MQINKLKDEEMKLALSKQVTQIEPSKELFNKIRKDIYEKEQEKTMKNKWFGLKKGKRLVTVLASCVILGSITIFGVTMGKSWIGSTHIEYMTFPSEEKVLKDVGFSPKYTKSLPGGFEFKNGGPGNSRITDDTGNILTESKHISLSYEKEGGKSPITLNVEKIEKEFIGQGESKYVGNLEGIGLYYYNKDYKFVPEDYELTEEDKLAYEAGKMEISYGASDVSIENVQSLSWYEDGLSYALGGNDYHFTVEEMIEMAQVIIAQK